MDADRLFLAAIQPRKPTPAQPEDLVTDVESEHEASLEWFESRLRSYTDRIVSELSAEQRRLCDHLLVVTRAVTLRIPQPVSRPARPAGAR